MIPHYGNAFNQLALIATYCGDDLGAIYNYFRSLVVSKPFTTAKDNLKLLFEKFAKKSFVNNDSAPLQKRFLDSFIRLHGLLYCLDEYVFPHR